MSQFSKPAQEILIYFEQFKLSQIRHLGQSFLDHLIGVYKILQSWNEPESVQLAGLCHSIYGTEFFRNTPVTEERREEIRKIIGDEAERLSYLFCALVRDSLFENSQRSENFIIFNRLTGRNEKISEKSLRGLLAIALANNLEQRPREATVGKGYHKESYRKLRSMFSETAYAQFLKDYQIDLNGDKNILVLNGTKDNRRLIKAHLESHGFSCLFFEGNKFPEAPLSSIVDLGSSTLRWYDENLTQLSKQCERYILLSSDAVYRQLGNCSENQFDPFVDVDSKGLFPRTLFTRDRENRVANAGFKSMVFVRSARILNRSGINPTFVEQVRKMLYCDEILIPEKSIIPPMIELNMVIEFLTWVVLNDIEGPVNVSSPGEISRYHFFQNLLKQAPLKPPLKLVPSSLDRQETYFLDCNRAKSLGYEFGQLESWLPLVLEKSFGPQQFAAE